MFVGVTHAAVRTACRGDAVRRPATVVHSGRMRSNPATIRAPPPPGDPPGRPYIAWRRGAGSDEPRGGRAAVFAGTTHAAVRTACRGDAVHRSAMVGPPPHPDPLRPRRGGEGSARLSEPTGSSRLFPTKQQRDASPWQGEAGAQRRVRVDPVVVRPLRVHVVRHPAPCLAAAIPSR